MKLHDDMKPKILQRVRVAEESGCWEWIGTLNADGYGKVVVGYKDEPRQPIKSFAHRVAFQAWRGPITQGLELDHLCRNRKCCNPEHLELVTRKENVRRGDLPRFMKEKAANQTHCYKGHELSGDNSVLQGPDKKNRVCRTCRAQRQRERYYKSEKQNRKLRNEQKKQQLKEIPNGTEQE